MTKVFAFINGNGVLCALACLVIGFVVGTFKGAWFGL